MASIAISNLRSTGSELFLDSESFLNELTEQELGNVIGGIWHVELLWSSVCFGGG